MATRYFCDACDKEFDNPDQLKKLIIHREPVPDYKRDICDTCVSRILRLIKERDPRPA